MNSFEAFFIYFDRHYETEGVGALWLAKEAQDGGFNYALEKRIYQQLLWRVASMVELDFCKELELNSVGTKY